MKKRILIAEDDPDILYILNLILCEEGYETDLSPRGKTIVEGKHQWPDLFLLDKQMPDMDGIEICKFLKSNETTRNIPVIMISASPGLGLMARDAGAEDFLQKPFKAKALLSTIKKHMLNDQDNGITSVENNPH